MTKAIFAVGSLGLSISFMTSKTDDADIAQLMGDLQIDIAVDRGG